MLMHINERNPMENGREHHRKNWPKGFDQM